MRMNGKHRSWWPEASKFTMNHEHQQSDAHGHMVTAEDDAMVAELQGLLLGESVTCEVQASSQPTVPVTRPDPLHTSAISEAHGVPASAAPISAQEPAEWMWQEALIASVCVLLTGESHSLLLQLIPPLHPTVLGTGCVVAERPLAMRDVVRLPLGAAVEVAVVGVAADCNAQAVAVNLPVWLGGGAPGWHVPVSLTPGVGLDSAARLVVEGQSGRSPCYHPMSETLPLAGVLGLCLTDGSTALSLADLHARGYLTLPPHLTHLLAQPPPNPAAAPTPTGSHQDAESTDTPVVSVSDGVQANQTAEEQVSELQQQQQAPPPQQETLPAQAQQAPQAPPAAPPAKSAHDAEFELWMQQDERMGSKAALKAAAELGDTRGLLPTGDVVAAAQAAVQAQAGQRVLWLSDVGVGDLVEVAPLAAVAHDGGAEAGGGAGCDDSITGCVAEVVMDDAFQPQGVLVRLEDDTMGHVRAVYERGHRQAQAAWPTLGDDPFAGKGGKGKHVKTKSECGKKSHGSGGSGSGGGGSYRPAGGIRVIRKASGLRNDSQESQAAASGGSASKPRIKVTRTLHSRTEEKTGALWKQLMEAYGEGLTGAVLEDCDGDVGEAVDVMLDQDALAGVVDEAVARRVAALEAEAVEEEERAVADRQRAAAARASKRGGGWAARPGSLTSRQPQQAPKDPGFPSLGGKAGGGREGGTAATKWGGGPPLGVKLLQKPDTLQSLAAKAGLDVRDAEALANLFPVLPPRAVVDVLALHGGDMARAIEALLADNVVSGPAPNSDATTASAPSTPAAPPQAPGPAGLPPSASGAELDALGAVLDHAAKVAHLVALFEGLDPVLADFTLHAHGGALRPAVADLQEAVHAHNASAAATQAADAAVAAALASENSFATALAAGLPPVRTPVPHVSKPGGHSARSTPQATPKLMSPAPSSTNLCAQAPPALPSPAADGEGWQVAGSGQQGGSGRVKSGGADASKARPKLSASKARAIAQLYFDARNVYYQQAAAAYNMGDGRAASELSRRGREYGELAKQYRQVVNDEAYRASNLGVHNQFRMDLHGMHVDEALELLERQLDALSRLVFPEGVLLKVITGRGVHSVGNNPRIKPAVLEALAADGWKSFVEPGNEGVVVVHVMPGGPASGR